MVDLVGFGKLWVAPDLMGIARFSNGSKLKACCRDLRKNDMSCDTT